ncbi:hypothetical protein HK107_09835 [Parvularcula sp. ZS-1/3]|uniref:Uncharacterized protein n=1 Tax=Parvularcula mediterranea TaxID=2732508 RepID=A0A7Y3RN01_9PROT|nr:hypothetical protein [Parvularcula mediterranea]NNU16620.1 hypothetical protein [Parvularcula mediterranea]
MSDDDHPKILPEERSIFETDTWIKYMWIGVPAAGAFFALMNTVLFFMGKTKPKFGWVDGNPVFYGIVGFVSFSFIVLAGQHLRKILMREEGYYDGPTAEMPRIGEDEEVRIRSLETGGREE